MKKLNIGCGTDIKEGWINLDMHGENGADIIFNLKDIYENKKLPFNDNSIDEIYCSHVLEDFIEPIPLLNEFVRVLKYGGRMQLETPTEQSTWTSIYHQKPYSIVMFYHYCETHRHKQYTKRTYNLKVIRSEYYYRLSNKWSLGSIYVRLGCWIWNKLGHSIVEWSFIKYLFCNINLRVIITKLDNSQLSECASCGKQAHLDSEGLCFNCIK